MTVHLSLNHSLFRHKDTKHCRLQDRVWSCPPTLSERGYTNGDLFHVQRGLCSNTLWEDGLLWYKRYLCLFIGYCTGSPNRCKTTLLSPFSHYMLLPAFTNITSNDLSSEHCLPTEERPGMFWDYKMTQSFSHKWSNSSRNSLWGSKWELWNFTVCINVEGVSQSMPLLAFRYLPRNDYGLTSQDSQASTTFSSLRGCSGVPEGTPVQSELQLQVPAP